VHDLSGQEKTKEPKNTDQEEKEKKLFQTKRVGWGYGNTVIVGKLMDSLPKALFIGVIVALDLRGIYFLYQLLLQDRSVISWHDPLVTNIYLFL
jgi:hypothetical protein